MLRNTRLSAKIGLGFGVVLALLICLSVVVYGKLGGISRHSGTAVAYSDYHAIMLQREVDHLKWIRTLESLYLKNLDKVELQLDCTKCNLGQFLYGDAGKREVLQAAGLMRAKALVVTYDDTPSALKILHHVKHARPGLPVVVRTADDTHVEALKRAGAAEVVPEALESSVMLATHALAFVGVPLQRIVKRLRELREQQYGLLRGFFHGATDVGDRLADFMRLQGLDLIACSGGFKSLSPFNHETVPSFFLFDSWWSDFSAAMHRGGDVIKFTMLHRKIGFVEAVRYLARHLGLAIPDNVRGDWEAAERREAERQLVCEILTKVTLMCHEQLTPEIRERLKRQWGLDDDVINKFKIGLAIGGFYRRLRAMGYSREALLKTGMFVLRRADQLTATALGRMDEFEEGGLVEDFLVETGAQWPGLHSSGADTGSRR